MIVIRLQVIVQAKSRKFKGFAWKMKNFFDDFANVCIPPAHLVPSKLLPFFLPFLPAMSLSAFHHPFLPVVSLLCLPCPFPILPHYFLSFISCSFPAPYLLSFLLCLLPICLSLFLPHPCSFPAFLPPFLSTEPIRHLPFSFSFFFSSLSPCPLCLVPYLHFTLPSLPSSHPSFPPSLPCACHFIQMQVGHVVGRPKTAPHRRQWSFPASITPGRPPGE